MPGKVRGAMEVEMMLEIVMSWSTERAVVRWVGRSWTWWRVFFAIFPFQLMSLLVV